MRKQHVEQPQQHDKPRNTKWGKGIGKHVKHAAVKRTRRNSTMLCLNYNTED